METLFVLLPLALLIAAIAVGFFIWAARTGQFDDLETPAVRILWDDDVVRTSDRARPPACPKVEQTLEVSDVQVSDSPTSNIGPRTSDIAHRTSDIGHPIDIAHRTSDIEH
ncbi:MAG: cbb3-type cytochrome oxidase assembly protein CcoS [Bacteroidales bacterium]